MRSLLVRLLMGREIAELLRGYRPPGGKHNSLITGSPTSWSWGKGDHGSELDGLGDDDHTQYLNNARHDLTARHPLGTVVPHDALASLTEKAHGSLTGVTTSQHHTKYVHPTTGTCPQAPKAHTLASHSTKAHSELTNIGASDHHTPYTHPTTGTCPQAPKAHTLASHSTKAHSELTGVTASQHHAKTTSASELTSGVLPSKNRLPALTTNKIWKGVAGRPAEVDAPAGEATTFEVLDGHGDVGVGANQVAVGNHTHTLTLTQEWAALSSSAGGQGSPGVWEEMRSTTVSSAKKIAVWIQTRNTSDDDGGYARVLVDEVEKVIVFYAAQDRWSEAEHWGGNGGVVKTQVKCVSYSGPGGYGQKERSGMYSVGV